MRPRRPRRLVALTAALVVVLLAAGGVVAWRVLTPDPGDAAKSYFARLAVGDAAGALRVVDKSSIEAGPLLTEAALSKPESRPQAMTITRVERAGDAATIAVQYVANGVVIIQTLKAKRGAGRVYTLQSPFARLVFANIAPADRGRVTVNGVAVNADQAGPAFPGAYAIAVGGNALFAGRSATAVPSPDAAATITLPPPSLSEEGRTKADAAVAATLVQCAGQMLPQKPACPGDLGLFQAPGPGELKGDPPVVIEADGPINVTNIVSMRAVATITKQPTCTYTPALDALTFSCADGVVHLEITLTAADGKALSGRSEDAPLQPKGSVALDPNGQIQVTFS